MKLLKRKRLKFCAHCHQVRVQGTFPTCCAKGRRDYLASESQWDKKRHNKTVAMAFINSNPVRRADYLRRMKAAA